MKHTRYILRALTVTVFVCAMLGEPAGALPTLLPTRHPTDLPIPAPTFNPSRVPSLAPTSVPSIPAPSALPSSVPSVLPTRGPTPYPTPVPTTRTPTPLPSRAPTGVPSLVPTPAPTRVPSPGPSSLPSLVPSPAPTLSPSRAPSPLPSLSPSAAPTLVPTSAPSGSPTLDPTPSPSIRPTLTPSSTPTLEPSPAPSISPHPTPFPTLVPTASPTLQPSAVPTRLPTPAPTPEPSLEPTPHPSMSPLPTPLPSPGPSPVPSRIPTPHPSCSNNMTFSSPAQDSFFDEYDSIGLEWATCDAYSYGEDVTLDIFACRSTEGDDDDSKSGARASGRLQAASVPALSILGFSTAVSFLTSLPGAAGDQNDLRCTKGARCVSYTRTTESYDSYYPYSSWDYTIPDAGDFANAVASVTSPGFKYYACVEMTSVTGNVKWGRSSTFTISGVTNAPTIIPTSVPTTPQPTPSPTLVPSPMPSAIVVQKGQFLKYDAVNNTYIAADCSAGDYAKGIQGTYQNGKFSNGVYSEYPKNCEPCECDTTPKDGPEQHTKKCNTKTGDCACLGTYGRGKGKDPYCKIHQQMYTSYTVAFVFALSLFPFAAFVMGRGDLMLTDTSGAPIPWCKEGEFLACCRLSSHDGSVCKCVKNWSRYCLICMHAIFISAACSFYFACESRNHQEGSQEGVIGHEQHEKCTDCNWLGRKGNRDSWVKYTVDYSITRRIRKRIKSVLVEPIRENMSRRWRVQRLHRYWIYQMYAHNWKRMKNADEYENSGPVETEMAIGVGSLNDEWNLKPRVIKKGLEEVLWGSWVEVNIPSENIPTEAQFAATRIEALRPFKKVGRWQKAWQKWKDFIKLTVFILAFLVGVVANFLFFVIKLAFNVYIVVASVYLNPKWYKEQIALIHRVLKRALDDIHLPYVYKVYDRVLWLLSQIKININIAIDVTCTAARAPVYLTFDIALIFIIVVVLDSGIYVFLAILAESFRVDNPDDTQYIVSDFGPDITNLEVKPKDGEKVLHSKETNKTVFRVPTKKKWRPFSNWGGVRIARTNLTRALVRYFLVAVKAIVQVGLTKLYLKEFFEIGNEKHKGTLYYLPYWRAIEEGCNHSRANGGFALGGAETGVQALVSYAAWIFGIFFLCTLLNTFVWGYIGNDALLRKIAGPHAGLLSGGLKEMLKLEFHDENRKNRNMDRDHLNEDQTIRDTEEIINPVIELVGVDDIVDLRETGVRNSAAKKITGDDAGKLEDQFRRFVEKSERQFLPHQPARLQCANAIGAVGVWNYFRKLIWPKVLIMLKLTMGWWDSDVLQTCTYQKCILAVTVLCLRDHLALTSAFPASLSRICTSPFEDDIIGLGRELDVDKSDNSMDHTTIMSSIGTAHSIFWQLFPYCAIVAKAAEAFNAVPIFIAWDFRFFLVGRRARGKFSYVNSEASMFLSKRQKLKESLCDGDGQDLPSPEGPPGKEFYYYVDPNMSSHKVSGLFFKTKEENLKQMKPYSTEIEDQKNGSNGPTTIKKHCIVHTQKDFIEKNGDIYFGRVCGETENNEFVVELHYIVKKMRDKTVNDSNIEVRESSTANEWKAEYDENSGQYYYNNVNTGATTWEKPESLMNDAEKKEAATGEDGGGGSGGGDDNESRVQQESTEPLPEFVIQCPLGGRKEVDYEGNVITGRRKVQVATQGLEVHRKRCHQSQLLGVEGSRGAFIEGQPLSKIEHYQNLLEEKKKEEGHAGSKNSENNKAIRSEFQKKRRELEDEFKTPLGKIEHELRELKEQQRQQQQQLQLQQAAQQRAQQHDTGGQIAGQPETREGVAQEAAFGTSGDEIQTDGNGQAASTPIQTSTTVAPQEIVVNHSADSALGKANAAVSKKEAEKKATVDEKERKTEELRDDERRKMREEAERFAKIWNELQTAVVKLNDELDRHQGLKAKADDEITKLERHEEKMKRDLKAHKEKLREELNSGHYEIVEKMNGKVLMERDVGYAVLKKNILPRVDKARKEVVLHCISKQWKGNLEGGGGESSSVDEGALLWWWSSSYYFKRAPAGLELTHKETQKHPKLKYLLWLLHVTQFAGQTGISFKPSRIFVYLWVSATVIIVIVGSLARNSTWDDLVAYCMAVFGKAELDVESFLEDNDPNVLDDNDPNGAKQSSTWSLFWKRVTRWPCSVCSSRMVREENDLEGKPDAANLLVTESTDLSEDGGGGSGGGDDNESRMHVRPEESEIRAIGESK